VPWLQVVDLEGVTRGRSPLAPPRGAPRAGDRLDAGRWRRPLMSRRAAP